MDNYHYIQLEILKQLLFKPKARFSDLNTTGITNDHFTFHLKQLLKQKLIVKDDQEYSLTDKGMEIAGRLDSKSGQLFKQPKTGVTLGVFRDVNDTLEVLVTKRKKDQSISRIAWIDRKLRLGESLHEAASKCLLEETGLQTNNFEFAGVTRVIRKKEEIIEIDVIAVCLKVINPEGELIEETDVGINSWVKYNELMKMKNKLEGFNKRLEAYKNNEIILHEIISN